MYHNIYFCGLWVHGSLIHHCMKFCLFKFDRGVLRSTWSNLIIAQSCGDTDWVCHNDKKENIESSLCDKTVYIAKWRKWLYLLQNSFEWKQLENLKSKTYNHSRLVSHTLYPGSLSCSPKTLLKSQYQNWVECWEILMDWITWGRCWGLTGPWQWQSCRQSSVKLSPGSSPEGRSVWGRSSTLSSTSQTGQSDGPWPGTVAICWGLYPGLLIHWPVLSIAVTCPTVWRESTVSYINTLIREDSSWWSVLLRTFL